MQAAEILAKEDINVAVINARFIKPLDDELIAKYCQPYSHVITVEEGSLAGGFGSRDHGALRAARHPTTSSFHRIGIPDEYVHHGAQDVLRAQYDLHRGRDREAGAGVRAARKHAERSASSRDARRDLATQIPDEELRDARERQGLRPHRRVRLRHAAARRREVMTRRTSSTPGSSSRCSIRRRSRIIARADASRRIARERGRSSRTTACSPRF